MPADKLNKKWYPLIWIALILSSFMRRAYGFYVTYSSVSIVNRTVLTDIFTDIIFSGFLPAVLCYLCASILLSFAYRRRNIFISRNDFVYIAMIFTAAARFLMGFIEVFAIVEPAVYSFTFLLLDVSVLTALMFAMYFGVLVPKYKMNDRVAYEVFSLFATVYLIVLGLNTVVPALGVIMLHKGGGNIEQIAAIFEQYYVNLYSLVDENMYIGALVSICVYGAWIIASLTLASVMHRRAVRFIKENPDEREKSAAAAAANSTSASRKPTQDSNGENENYHYNGGGYPFDFDDGSRPRNGEYNSDKNAGGRAQNGADGGYGFDGGGQAPDGGYDNNGADSAGTDKKDENVFDEFDL